MELNWSTFVLEIVNFLILIWILKHFFYMPVMTMIETRRKGIEEKLSEAKTLQIEARDMEQKYQARLSDWEKEKKQALGALHDEINSKRVHQMELLQVVLEKERQKSRVLDERRLNDEKRRIDQTALNQGAQFVSKLLKRLASPELENRLFQLFLDELPNLPKERLESLRVVYCESPGPAKITSAYPLADEHRTALQKALTVAVGENIECQFVIDKELISGIRVNLEPLVLRANILDEMHFFTESANGAG